MVNSLLLSDRELSIPALTSFQQQILDNYCFQDWEYQGWVVVPGNDYLGFKRGSEKSMLTAKLIFQKQSGDFENVRFAGVVVAPSGETIDGVIMDDPFMLHVRRWIYGRIPCYLEGATNVSEFLDVYKRYRR